MNKGNNCSPRKRNNNLDNWIDNFFNHNIGDFMGADFVKNQAAANIVELPDAFRIELAAPGLEKTDFDIKVEKNRLSIAVNKTVERSAEDGKFTRREFDFNTFQRSFQLRKDIEMDQIDASYEQGVLSLVLPKKVKEEAVEKRTITIS
ncbi:MAG: Hsp20/alpha crystallin family protein [Saprospiraceae bacterium]